MAAAGTTEVGAPPELAQKRLRSSGRVVLNVGSERFETTLETLRGHADSFFGGLASGRHRVQWEEDGSIFIDRSPEQFPTILEYLRNGPNGLIMPDCPRARLQLQLEAEFYGLSDLVARLRHFRLMNSHAMAFRELPLEDGRAGHPAAFRPLSPAAGKYPLGVLHGFSGSSAVFDVQEPDNFEVTFRGRSRGGARSWDDWSDLFRGRQNAPGIFVGVVPADSDLSEEWLTLERPLPRGSVAPWIRDHGKWLFAGSEEDAQRTWPRTARFPAALRRGFGIVYTVCKFDCPNRCPDDEFAASAFLLQFVSRGDLAGAGAEGKSVWTEAEVGAVGMVFARTPDECTLEFRVTDTRGMMLSKVFNLADEGLPASAPFRPAIFFGKRASTSVEEVCDLRELDRDYLDYI